jgi:hypothetical protein
MTKTTLLTLLTFAMTAGAASAQQSRTVTTRPGRLVGRSSS